MSGSDRSPALDRLEAFIGTWDVEAGPFQGPDSTSPVRGRTEFEWTLDRRFLVQRSTISYEHAPDALAIVGLDGSGDAYTQHYFDSRGIARTYEMTFDGQIWTLTRRRADFSPLDFSQRFTGTFDDSTTVRGAWESCLEGEDWEHDFDLTYTKSR